MVTGRVGLGEGHASCSHMRHSQLPISNRDILTFGILSEVFLCPAPLSEKTAEGLERQVWGVGVFLPFIFFKALSFLIHLAAGTEEGDRSPSFQG